MIGIRQMFPLCLFILLPIGVSAEFTTSWKEVSVVTEGGIRLHAKMNPDSDSLALLSLTIDSEVMSVPMDILENIKYIELRYPEIEHGVNVNFDGDSVETIVRSNVTIKLSRLGDNKSTRSKQYYVSFIFDPVFNCEVQQ